MTKKEIEKSKFRSETDASPSWKTRLLSSIFANFSTFIFCTKFEDLYESSPPLKGAGGMLFSNLSGYLGFLPDNIPLTPFKGGISPCKSKFVEKNFNILALVKQNLLALRWRGLTGLANLTLFGILCLLNACDIVNPEEALPAYLKIENFDFSTTPQQGTASEQITDVWVFVNDLSLGVYELPATIPSLAVGNQDVTVFPVIRENGVRSTPIIYPFYQRFETTLDLKIGETVTIQPSTSYVNNAVFELIEEFDGGGHLLKGGNPTAVQIIDEVGQILLGDEESVEFTSSGTFVDLPTSNGLAVFLELEYQTNVEFEIGLVGIDPNATNPINATVYNVVLCPINRWNKVYINLQAVLEISQLPGYKLAFRVSTDNTADCESVSNGAPEVLIDNLKFIRLSN